MVYKLTFLLCSAAFLSACEYDDYSPQLKPKSEIKIFPKTPSIRATDPKLTCEKIASEVSELNILLQEIYTYQSTLPDRDQFNIKLTMPIYAANSRIKYLAQYNFALKC